MKNKKHLNAQQPILLPHEGFVHEGVVTGKSIPESPAKSFEADVCVNVTTRIQGSTKRVALLVVPVAYVLLPRSFCLFSFSHTPLPSLRCSSVIIHLEIG